MKHGNPRRHVILSGCSGGGKSTLLTELRRRGFGTVKEPGRRIVAEELRGDGQALPWVNLEAFARRAIRMAVEDRERVKPHDGWIFFDRGLIDAAMALEHASAIPAEDSLTGHCLFHRQVFLTPPWPAIYLTDVERRQDMAEGLREYERLRDGFERLGYDPVILPRARVAARADFVLERLSGG